MGNETWIVDQAVTSGTQLSWDNQWDGNGNTVEARANYKGRLINDAQNCYVFQFFQKCQVTK